MHDEGSPQLSMPAVLELRRIFCKHLAEVVDSPETRELHARGYLAGHVSAQHGASFVIDAVTPRGRELLAAREAE